MDSACAARRCHRVGEGFHFLRAAGDSEGELKVGTLPGLFNCGDIGEDAEASANTEPALIAMDAPKLIVPRGAACLAGWSSVPLNVTESCIDALGPACQRGRTGGRCLACGLRLQQSAHQTSPRPAQAASLPSSTAASPLAAQRATSPVPAFSSLYSTARRGARESTRRRRGYFLAGNSWPTGRLLSSILPTEHCGASLVTPSSALSSTRGTPGSSAPSRRMGAPSCTSAPAAAFAAARACRATLRLAQHVAVCSGRAAAADAPARPARVLSRVESRHRDISSPLKGVSAVRRHRFSPRCKVVGLTITMR